MQEAITIEVVFNIWWVLTDGLLYYGEVEFLLRFGRAIVESLSHLCHHKYRFEACIDAEPLH